MYNIRAVANGWVVTPHCQPHMVTDETQTFVFTDFAKLSEWIKENIVPLEK